jgi:Cu/Ag efflux protein CusF
MNSARKTRLLMLSCLVVTALTGAPLFGQTVTQQSAAAVASPVPFSKGRLETLDVAHKMLTIQTKSGSETFRLTDFTKVFHGKEGLALDLLKTGDVVAVRFALDEHGDRVARIIKLDIGTEPSPLDTGVTSAPRPAEVRP